MIALKTHTSRKNQITGKSGNATDFIEKLIAERKGIIDRAVDRYFPRRLDSEKLEFICGPPSYDYDLEAVSNAIYAPGWDLLDRGGKRWRPLLMMLVIEALGKKPDDFLDFLAIPEVVHNGTLIIDDIEDGSDLRRGKPCVHKIYGTDIAVNAGNGMYYIPLLPVIKGRKKYPDALLLDICEIYLQEMINISHGQAMDIYWHRGNKSGITVEQYMQMCAYKTGTLARMSAKLGARLAGADDRLVHAFGKFAESIAVAFQIQDDVLNLRQKLGKETGEDIKEGKRSLLVIRALSRLPKKDAGRLLEILSMHTGDKKLVNEAIRLIKATDAFGFAETLSKKLVDDSWAALEKMLPPSDAKRSLQMFAEYLIARGR